MAGYPLNPEMVDRMNADLCFEIAEAAQDFGYSAREFAYSASAEDRNGARWE